jgi:hypothetical protein
VSKTTENVLLVPGESGWEIWTGLANEGFTLVEATTCDKAGDLTTLPAGDLLLLFPVKAITAVPMRVASDDEALFPDLAALHAERLGLRPDPLAGQLTDIFVIARAAENTALVSVFLRVPSEGEMPPRGPKGFDISARAYPTTGDTLAIWKELGRWVFSLSHQGMLVYCQATSVMAESPDAHFTREIRLALMQLSMQGLEIEPTHVVVWSQLSTLDTTAVNQAFHVPIEVSPRPAPTLPQPLSKLLPADVRAARRVARKRRNIILGIAAVGLLYLGLIGWFAYGLWKDNATTQRLVAEATAAAPEGEAYSLHTQKWDELADAIQIANSPVEILRLIASCRAPGGTLRLKTADISASEIKLVGEGPQLADVNTFSLNLAKNQDLHRFKWQTPEASQATRGWEFVYTGQVLTPVTPP